MGSKFSVSRMRKELAASTMSTVTTTEFVISDVASANLDAAGTTVNNAATIVNHVTNVSGVANSGVKLPTNATSGEMYILSNVGIADVKVYASGTDTLNGLAAGLASVVTLSASTGAVAVKAGSTNWAFLYSKV